MIAFPCILCETLESIKWRVREFHGQITENARLKKRVDDRGHDIMSPLQGLEEAKIVVTSCGSLSVTSIQSSFSPSARSRGSAFLALQQIKESSISEIQPGSSRGRFLLGRHQPCGRAESQALLASGGLDHLPFR